MGKGKARVCCQLYSYIFFAFSLLRYVIFIKVCKENLASQRYVIRKGRSILVAFLDNREHYSLTLNPNSRRESFLKVSCTIESETVSVNLSCSATLKSTGLSCTLSGSFTHAWHGSVTP